MNIREPKGRADFEAMDALERLYYDDEYITGISDSMAWFAKHPHTFRLAEENGRVLGFLCLFPVGEAVYEQIHSGTYNDKYMTADDVLSKEECVARGVRGLFLSCVVVHHEARGRGVVDCLLAEYTALYQSWNATGAQFSTVITDNVTAEGVAFSKRLGLQPIATSDHDSVICEGAFPFVRVR
ncbi:MAG: GNAT family N-acetyltransferase [Bacilli bacterium]